MKSRLSFFLYNRSTFVTKIKHQKRSTCLHLYICPFESLHCFPVLHLYFLYVQDSQKDLLRKFDRMRVYRQLSTGHSKILRLSWRNWIQPPGKCWSPIPTGSDQRNLITEDVVYAITFAHSHKQASASRFEKRIENFILYLEQISCSYCLSYKRILYYNLSLRSAKIIYKLKDIYNSAKTMCETRVRIIKN